MKWSDVRKAYPNQWLVIEALHAHTTPQNRRILDKIAIIDHYGDGGAAMQSYRQLHRQYPNREFYFVHTSREELDIIERQWLGIKVDVTTRDGIRMKIMKEKLGAINALYPTPTTLVGGVSDRL